MRGVLAGFATEHALRQALDRLVAEHIKGVETYTPVALKENPTGSPLPLVMFVAGVLGFVGFFALMAYADVWAYPLNIGGRPRFRLALVRADRVRTRRAVRHGSRVLRLFSHLSNAATVRSH